MPASSAARPEESRPSSYSFTAARTRSSWANEVASIFSARRTVSGTSMISCRVAIASNPSRQLLYSWSAESFADGPGSAARVQIHGQRLIVDLQRSTSPDNEPLSPYTGRCPPTSLQIPKQRLVVGLQLFTSPDNEPLPAYSGPLFADIGPDPETTARCRLTALHIPGQ